MVWQVKALAAFVEDLGSVPVQALQLTNGCDSSFKGFSAFFWLLRALMHLVHIHAGKTQTCIKTNKALKQTNKNPHIVLGFLVDMRGGGGFYFLGTSERSSRSQRKKPSLQLVSGQGETLLLTRRAHDSQTQEQAHGTARALGSYSNASGD